MKTNGKHAIIAPVVSVSNRGRLTAKQPATSFRGSPKVARFTETLLVVDHDPSVRQLEVEILSQQGYRVIQAHDAAEALGLAGGAVLIHLLITEFSMPNVDGLELSHRFRSMHPRTPVLMVSGFLPLLHDGRRDLGQVLLLVRPFSSQQLLEKVRTLLDAAPFQNIHEPWAHD